MSIDNGPQVERRDLVAFPAEPSRTGDKGLPGAETWDIDENSSSIFFVIRNRFTSLRGEFNEFSGVLTFDRAPERSRVGVKIVAASISTGHTQRDAALRGAHFLDLDYLGLLDDPWGSQWAGFSTRTEIRLDDFGISGHRLFRLGGLLAGTTVRIEFEIDAMRRGRDAAPAAARGRRGDAAGDSSST